MADWHSVGIPYLDKIASLTVNSNSIVAECSSV